jgi:PIN domain nuclease of toxin-antitoxin system
VGKLALLLDTHIFLWWLFADNRLPEETKTIIENPENSILVSAASVWEIATKFRIGKLPEGGKVADNVPIWIEKAGFQPLAISPEHAQLAVSWELSHRDPFDRMLAAQAKLENIRLASVDQQIMQFPIQILNR